MDGDTDHVVRDEEGVIQGWEMTIGSNSFRDVSVCELQMVV